jgi:hypothetical protein
VDFQEKHPVATLQKYEMCYPLRVKDSGIKCQVSEVQWKVMNDEYRMMNNE